MHKPRASTIKRLIEIKGDMTYPELVAHLGLAESWMPTLHRVITNQYISRKREHELRLVLGMTPLRRKRHRLDITRARVALRKELITLEEYLALVQQQALRNLR